MTRRHIFLPIFLMTLHQVLLGQGKDIRPSQNCFYEITSLSSDNFDDLNFLKRKVKDKRVVLLGESSHTVGDYYLLKTRLVKFLHQECGFEVFAMESGIADVFTVYGQLDTLSAAQLMKKTLFANLSSNEMKPLFEYIKTSTHNKLHYCGFDSQNHGSSLDLIKSLLQKYYGAKSDSLVENLKKYYQIPQLVWQADKAPVSKLADTIMTSASELIRMLQSKKIQLIESRTITDLHFSIRHLS